MMPVFADLDHVGAGFCFRVAGVPELALHAVFAGVAASRRKSTKDKNV
jgi:hypothetical protein